MTAEEKKEYQKQYYLKNKEKIRINQKAYNLANSDKLKAKNKEYAKLHKPKYSLEQKIKNKEYMLIYNKKYYSNNKDSIKTAGAEYYEKNKEAIRLQQKKYSKIYLSNPENRIKINEYSKNRRKNDSLYKLKNILRTRIYYFLKSKKFIKSKSTEELLGCSYSEFKAYFELMFIDNMNWDNHGEWHIDHIIPLDSAKSEEDTIILCHYSNLQPLWANENLIKSNKIIN